MRPISLARRRAMAMISQRLARSRHRVAFGRVRRDRPVTLDRLAARQSPSRPGWKSEGVGERQSNIPLADEPTAFVQIMVPGELQERLADVTHVLSLTNPKVRHQKTILGVLVWAYIDPDDPTSLNRLGHTLDQYLDTDAAEVPADSKVAAHMPFSLKWRLDGAVIKLRRTRRSGRTTTSTRSSTCSAATPSAGPSSTAKTPRSPRR
jgi:hypothetical protein